MAPPPASTIGLILGDVDPAGLGSMIMEAQLFVARLDREVAGCAAWDGSGYPEMERSLPE